MKNFSKGTVVRITNPDFQYTTYFSWMSKNAPEYFDAWYNRTSVLDRFDDRGKCGVVVKHAPHGTQPHELHLVFVDNNFHIIDEEGLERAYKKSKPFEVDVYGNVSVEEVGK